MAVELVHNDKKDYNVLQNHKQVPNVMAVNFFYLYRNGQSTEQEN